MREVHITHSFAQPQDHAVLRRLDAIEALLRVVGGHIMTQLDDLRAAQAETAANLAALATGQAALSTNVGELAVGVTSIDAEVKALLMLIGQNNVPQDVVDAAKALAVSSGGLRTQADSLVTQSQAVEDQIAAIPPTPAQG